jgi:xanthine dehydrogenase small subunit
MAAESTLIGGQWDLSAVRRAQAAVERELSPIGDHRGSAAYRLAMAQSLIAKFEHEMQGALV